MDPRAPDSHGSSSYFGQGDRNSRQTRKRGRGSRARLLARRAAERGRLMPDLTPGWAAPPFSSFVPPAWGFSANAPASVPVLPPPPPPGPWASTIAAVVKTLAAARAAATTTTTTTTMPAATAPITVPKIEPTTAPEDAKMNLAAVSPEGPPASKATPVAEPTENPSNVSGTHLQELLRRIINLEFSERCSQRSIAVWQTIVDTLCDTPTAVIKMMEVLDESFAKALKSHEQQGLMNRWYLVDAVMKLFREKPTLLKAILVALPHLLITYVPWKGSDLASESWIDCDADKERYEHLFQTWERSLPKVIHDDLMAMWKNGIPPANPDEPHHKHPRREPEP